MKGPKENKSMLESNTGPQINNAQLPSALFSTHDIFEIQTERSKFIFEICSSESRVEIQINLNRTIADPKFSIKLLVLALQAYFNQKLVDPKSTRTEPYPTQTEATQNVT